MEQNLRIQQMHAVHEEALELFKRKNMELMHLLNMKLQELSCEW